MNTAKHSAVAATIAASLSLGGGGATATSLEFKDALDACGGLVRKDGALTVKAIRETTREVDFIASTGTIDCHWEVIDQESWQLSDYETNPIVLYGHQAYDLPIGQCTYVAVRNGMLECTIKFSDATVRAQEVWKLVAEKTLRAVSVGFRPVNGSYEVRNGEEIWVWRNSILKEISVVAIGANPEALAKMKAATPPVKGSNVHPAGAPAVLENSAGAPGNKKGTEAMKTAEQLATELAEKTAAHAETMSKLTTVNVKLVETEARADKADAARTVAEKSLADSATENASLKLAAKTLETEHTKACTDRDAATKKAGELEDKLIDLEVESVVGKKITPAEKAEFIELRKSNEKLYTSMISKRADMALETRVTADDAKTNGKGENSLSAPTNGGGAAAAAFNDL